MAATSESPRNALGTAERRARVRAPVTPPIYVSMDNMNGGLVFNLSEDGLALTAALDLADGELLALRIYLPDSKGWVEASGKIAWRGESEKEGGIRFEGLAEEARERIREWLAAENAEGETQRKPELLPTATAELYRPNEAATARLVSPERRDHGVVEEESLAEDVVENNASLAAEQAAGDAAESLEQPLLAELESAADAEPLERRSHERCAIDAVSYIRLGRENGGTLLNISEGGFAVRAARSVGRDDLATIRIQFTESWDCLEVSGKIAWSNESEKKAGIRFVSLTEDARAKITRWLALDEGAGELQEQSAENAESQAADAAHVAASEIGGDRVAAAIAGSPRWGFGQAGESKAKTLWAIFQLRLGSGPARMWHLVAAVILAEITALAIVWVVAPHGFQQAVVAFLARNGAAASESAPAKKPSGTNLGTTTNSTTTTNNEPTPANQAGPTNQVPMANLAAPTNQATNVSPVPAENTGSPAQVIQVAPANDPPVRREERVAPVVPQARSEERPATTPTREGTSGATESAQQKNTTEKLPGEKFFTMPNPTVEAPRSKAAESLPSQLTVNSVANAAASAGGLAIGKGKEGPAPPPEPPVAPATAVWSVTVTTDPYPMIKLSRKMDPKKSKGEGNLELGRITKRADPVYPEEAKQQGIEGTVKLHIIAGRDGAVQKVEAISGPPLLAKAAISAVREWRYTKTFLDGQAIETEQDVLVSFRKGVAGNSKK
ncbi:MAG: PilZ domain-containing protein [Candidatus Acidiferrum sp.]